MSAEPRLVYADSSALVKLVIEEPESAALERYVASGIALATSRIAAVEVTRATRLANAAAQAAVEKDRLLDSCLLVDVGRDLLADAAEIASSTVRTLDAIHLASALRIDAEEMVVYDRRLSAAAVDRHLPVASPGGE